MVHFDEEIERASEIRSETTETLKAAMDDVASGKGVDVEKVSEASVVITDSIMRNVDAMVSLTRIKKHDPYTAMHCMNVCTLVVAVAQGRGHRCRHPDDDHNGDPASRCRQDARAPGDFEQTRPLRARRA